MARTKKNPTVEDVVKSGYVDLTKTGPLSYRELKSLNNNLPSESIENSIVPDNIGVTQALQRAGKVNYTETPNDFGESTYDKGLLGAYEFENYQDLRAEAQPWYAKIGAGLAKGAILAGTTFLDGTIGLLLGGAEAVAQWDASRLWDNDFSRAMQTVNEWSEEALPNYYSQEELNSPWYENIFTANFIGDKFIKNLGFSIGALYSGGVTSAGLKLTGLPKLIGAITLTSKAPAVVSTAVGAITSAVNEGRIEALNNSKDWQDLKIQELDDAWRNQLNMKYATHINSIKAEYEAAYREYESTKGKLQRVNTSEGTMMVDPAVQKYEAKLAELQQRKEVIQSMMESEFQNRDSNGIYNKALGKIAEDRLKMGNVDMLLNLPILTFSNIVQFTKFYSNGFNTARRAGIKTVEDATEGAARYAGKTFSKGQAALRVTKGALAEGTEEISQKAASLVSGDYYSTDVNNFYKSQVDKDAEKETLSWIKSTASGINETVNDGSSWEEFFIGALTGLLGVPTFRSIRNADGSLRSPIKLEGGAYNEIKDYQEEITRSQELADYLNNRVQSPEFLNYYRGLIRHNKYQNDMNRAAEDNDAFNFKNAEHAQFVSDIIMFDKAGKLEDLVTLINSAYDTSDANLQSIVENTTSTTKDGKKVGPFIDSNGNPLYATPEGKKDMIDKLTQNKETMSNVLDNYVKSKNYIDSRTGQPLSDSQLEELTWMKTQLTDWENRAATMSGEIKQVIGKVIGNLDSFIRFQDAIRTEEGMRHANITDRYSRADKNVRDAERAVNTLNTIRTLDDASLAANLARNPEFVNGLIKEVTLLDDTVIDTEEREDVISKLKDIIKLGKASAIYNAKFDEYLSNPEQQATDHKIADQKAAQSVQEDINASLRQKLDQATSVSQFRQIFNEEQDAATKASVLQAMESENNQMAQNYKETSLYNNELNKALDNLGESADVIQDARTLWQEQFNNAENIEQVANPNSIYVNNDNAFLEDSGNDALLAENRFQKARYALQTAMSKVNNDIRFRDRFSEEYRKPVDEPVANKGTDKDETGDSGTSTVPYVNPNATPVETPYVPVGNVTAEMVAAENRDTNSRVETQRSLDQSQQGQRKYYRPAVPELHIEASKEGDFRPFDTVVAEREPNVDFSGIYNYLKENGAFSYVNAAKLKPGDTLGFMIDPDFNDHTIFLVDTRNNQIVGSIDESDASVARYEGLEEFIKKVRDEYQTSRSGTSTKIVSTQTYTYSKGRVRTSEVHEVSRTTDREGTVIVQLEEIITSDSEKQSLVGRKISKGGLEISVDSDIIDWKRQASGGRREDGSVITPEQVTSEMEQEAKEQMEILLENTNGVIQPFRVSTIFYSKDGRIIAKDSKGNYIYLKSDPLSSQSSSSPTISKFFATPQIRVSKMMVGRIPYGTEDRSLADIPGVLDGEAKPVFGIIKNGTITTNEKIDDRLIIKPVDMAQKEGRLYLLIPNAAGTYSPAAVRVKHFNNQEFNLDDATVANTPIGKDINEALDRLADATSQDDVSVAMKELAQDIHLQDVMVTWFDAKAGSGIVISKKVRKPDGTYEMVNINGQEQIKENKYSIYFQDNKEKIIMGGMEVSRVALEEGVRNGLNTPDQLAAFGQPRDVADIRKGILNTLLGFNLPIQVSISKINDSGYNNRVIKSNVLTSNLKEAKVIGSWFTTDYFDKQGNLQKSVSPSSVKPVPSSRTTTPVGGTEGVTQGTSVRIGNSTYTVDLKTMVYTDSNGTKHSITTSNANIFAMAWAQENFGDSTESSVMTENKVITPQGRVLDRNTGTYVSDAEAKRIKDKLAEKGQGSQQQESLPIFNSSIETMITNPKEQNRVLPENAFEEGGKIGYYEKDSKLYTGYLKNVGEVDGVPIHLTKVRDRGFGRAGELGSTSEYLTVFPNGMAISTRTNDTNDDHAADIILDALTKNPAKVQALASEKTQISDGFKKEEAISQPSRAATTIQREDAINNHDEEFEDELVLYDDFFDNPNYGKNIVKVDGLEARIGTDYTTSKMEELFHRFATLEQQKELSYLADRVFRVTDKLGIKVIFSNDFSFGKKGSYSSNNTIKLNHKFFTDDFLNHTKAPIILHEMIHAVTMYILSDKTQDRVTGNLKEAADAIRAVYDSKKNDPSLVGEYGVSNVKEMIAEMANPRFRTKLKKLNVWQEIKEAIKKLFSLDRTSSAFDTLDAALDLALDSFDVDLYNDYVGAKTYGSYNPNDWAFYREATNREKAEVTSEVMNWAGGRVYQGNSPNIMIDDLGNGHILTWDGLYTYHYEAGREVENIKFIYKNSDRNRSRIQKFIDNFYNNAYFESANYEDNSSWEVTPIEIRQALEAKGWTKEKFDSISQRERDQAVECLGL